MNLPRFPIARRWLLAACLSWTAATALAQASAYEQVQRLQQAGQISQALAEAKRHLAENPRDVQMRFIQANLLSAAGQVEEAQSELSTLTRDYPELPEPWNNLAVLHASRGQLDKAQEALEMALRINPAYATALENLGDVRVRQAAQAYGRARQLDAGNPRLAPKIEALRALTATGSASAPAAPASAPAR